jgi:hypothetical protein
MIIINKLFNLVIRSESKQQSTKNQMNPVDKYQEYKKFWSKQKVPGESDHSNLR